MMPSLTWPILDHAVTASTVYLIRSLGTVYGVAITSAIVQTTLSVRLPDALGEIPDKWRVRPFSLLFIFLCCLSESEDKRDTYTRTRHRLSTRSDTRYRPSRRFLRMYSSKHDLSTTTASATLLLCRRLSRRLPCALLCLPGHKGSAALNKPRINGEMISGLRRGVEDDAWWETKDNSGTCKSQQVGEKNTGGRALGTKPELKIEGLCFPFVEFFLFFFAVVLA